MSVLLGTILINLYLIFPALTDMTGYLAGGEYAFISQYPHAVYLKSDAPYMLRCGASIVTQRIILTAGKCFYFIEKPYNIVASMGNEREGLGQVRKVIDFTIHENFTEVRLANDIALGLLDQPVVFGANVQRVVLTRKPLYHQPAFVAGWGWINNDKEESIYLKRTIQRFVDTQDCHRVLGYGRIAEGTICMEDQLQKSRGFMGDTGNALIVDRHFQIGILSWGDIDANYNKMIYTNTSYFYNWIMSQATELNCRNEEP